MTIEADIKHVVGPLLQANPDLVRTKRLIALKPIRHLFRGLFLDRSSTKGAFFIQWFTMALCEPNIIIHFNFGARVYSGGRGLWRYDDPEVPQLLKSQVEAIALPKLKPIETIEDFYHLTRVGEHFDDRPESGGSSLKGRELKRIIIEAAMGDFETADITSARLLKVPNYWSTEPFVRPNYELVSQKLCPLIAARDRAGIGALLREWEESSVKKLKLEKYWEPSPFPVEMEG